MDVERTAQELDTPVQNGLTEKEAKRRIEQYGPNELADERKRTVWQMFAEQFKDFMIIVLLVAAVISGALGEWVDAVVIIIVVVLNAALGVVQESRAE